MVNSMRQVFDTAHISVNLVSTENLNLPELDDLEVGSCVRGVTTDEQNQLSRIVILH